jgi:hypothetical protein
MTKALSTMTTEEARIMFSENGHASFSYLSGPYGIRRSVVDRGGDVVSIPATEYRFRLEPSQMQEGRMYLTSDIRMDMIPSPKRASRGRSITTLMATEWGENGSLLTLRERERVYRHLNR